MAQTAVKLPTPIVEHARAAAKLHSRSIAGQVEHWVRIGRAIERSKSFSLDRVEAALRADLDADTLTPDEGVVYRDRFIDAMKTASPREVEFYKQLGEEADRFDKARAQNG